MQRAYSAWSVASKAPEGIEVNRDNARNCLSQNHQEQIESITYIPSKTKVVGREDAVKLVSVRDLLCE